MAKKIKRKISAKGRKKLRKNAMKGVHKWEHRNNNIIRRCIYNFYIYKDTFNFKRNPYKWSK